jgi:hypothetical protein
VLTTNGRCRRGHAASLRSDRYRKVGWPHLIAEVFRPKGEEFYKCRRGKVGIHELLRAGDGESCLQLSVDFGEKQRTARQRPLVERGEPNELRLIVPRREPQRDTGRRSGPARCVEASIRAASEQSQAHPL